MTRAMIRRPRSPGTERRRQRGRSAAAILVLVLGATLLPATPVLAADPEVPPAVDPGTPEFTGLEDPVPDGPVPFDPTTSTLQAFFEADQAAGGDSYWIDRVLERPGVDSSAAERALYTKGSALFMYTHNAGTLGFAGQGTGANQGGGGFGYREPIASGVTNLYTVSVSDAALTEQVDQRRQSPSHWFSVHTGGGLQVDQTKFITENNVAVTILKLTNTGSEATTRTITAGTPGVVTQSFDGNERIGTFNTRYNVTTVNARLSGEGFTPSGNNLAREVTIQPAGSVTVKLQLGAITSEIAASATDYQRYRDLGASDALRTHLAEYNQWWADNVPYIDVPDENVEKMAWYRTFLSRFNYFDANIPGNDFQFPVSVEGALGYNNAIQLTQPMHMQDLKYFRDPKYSYGNWLSSGETSKCDAFIDNPGSHSWGNTYEQYIAREGWNAIKVHGADPEVIANFAHYAECDVKGQLAKYDSNDNNLIEYNVGFLTGNDADTPTFHWAQFEGQPTRQDRAEAAFQWAGAKAAAEAYALIGNDAKAAEMEALAADIREAILTILWDDSPAGEPPTLEPQTATREAGQTGFGNAIRLNGGEPNQYVDLPNGIVSGLTDFTIGAWVNWNGSQTWSRIFDFGNNTGVYMFLTPNAGGAPGLRFAITTSGAGGEQLVESNNQLPTGWHHVAVTLEGTVGTLWVDGVAVGTNPNITITPGQLGGGNTTNNWIGRSQFGDPLLNGAIDDFNIFDRALTQEELQSLVAAPGGGTLGGGNVAWYQFDEVDGNSVVDSSGNGRDGTVETVPGIVGDWPGKVFKHRLTSNGERVQWKDQQNFLPFIEGLVPNDPEYTQALRFYGDAEEYPIMPFYTANQRDKQFAAALGIPGSNNFSNINSTLQAQLYARAIREYPTEFITPGMLRRLIEWSSWVQYIGGDTRRPDNNEFFFNWDPEDQTLGRSGIHHNILGGFNFMLVDDMAGLEPRLDDRLELWPIDIGYDWFAINNLSYHGHDLTLVWDRPDGDVHYAGVPEGYTAYLDGERIFTVSGLAHIVWNSKNGAVTVVDGTAEVTFKAAGPIPAAAALTLRDNERLAQAFQQAGIDLSEATGWAFNRARGKPVDASFTTTSPALRATDTDFVTDGYTISGLPANGPAGQAQAGYLAPNTIWGACDSARSACGDGTSDDEIWLAVDLLAPHKIDTLKIYFFNDKSYNPQQNVSRDTYRQPSEFSVQYHNGTDWVDVPGQVHAPDSPQANYNLVTFPQVTTQEVRVVMTRTGTFGIGVKEIQVFNTTETSLDAIRALVNQYRAEGQVTKEGASRLLNKLDRAQAELDKGSTAGAIRHLQQFIDDTALLEVYVPGEAARHALVDEAQQMISQLGGTPSPA